ncbi:MAG: hypothetical protein HY588_02040, partial [Candidatus Omnitrophica bacterium]|nr:hypothetical protein [Candidatus Omnitrophota bacterium]
MDFAIFLLTVVVVFYGIAFLFFMRGFFRTENRRFSWAGRLIELGFLTHTLLIFVQTLTSVPGMPSDFHLPVATVGEASGFFAWSLAFVYLILLRQLKGETFGLILTPVLVLFLVPAFFPFPVNDALLKHFHNHYFLIHILSAFFGYACFTLSFIT